VVSSGDWKIQKSEVSAVTETPRGMFRQNKKGGGWVMGTEGYRGKGARQRGGGSKSKEEAIKV